MEMTVSLKILDVGSDALVKSHIQKWFKTGGAIELKGCNLPRNTILKTILGGGIEWSKKT